MLLGQLDVAAEMDLEAEFGEARVLSAALAAYREIRTSMKVQNIWGIKVAEPENIDSIRSTSYPRDSVKVIVQSLSARKLAKFGRPTANRDRAQKTAPMPGELYHWAERFVLEHYVPEKKRKRKRNNWKESGRRRV